MFLMPLQCTLKMITMVHFMLCIFYNKNFLMKLKKKRKMLASTWIVFNRSCKAVIEVPKCLLSISVLISLQTGNVLWTGSNPRAAL